jgi:hypothetical protein
MTTRNETWTGAREFPIVGHYFELLSTVNAVDLVFFDADGRVIAQESAMEEGYFIDRRGLAPFAHFTITTSGAEAVKFIVTDGFSGNRSVPADITDRAARLLGIVYGSLGQLAQVLVNAVNYLRVQVQGHGDAETDAGNAFLRGTALAGVAAQYSHVQLINPAASGKTVYVDSIIIGSTGTPDRFDFCSHDTALTDVGAVYSKDQGGAAGVSHVRTTNNAVAQGTLIGNVRSGNLNNVTLTFDPPYKLGAGEGCLIRNATVNLQLEVFFQLREY